MFVAFRSAIRMQDNVKALKLLRPLQLGSEIGGCGPCRFSVVEFRGLVWCLTRPNTGNLLGLHGFYAYARDTCRRIPPYVLKLPSLNTIDGSSSSYSSSSIIFPLHLNGLRCNHLRPHLHHHHHRRCRHHHHPHRYQHNDHRRSSIRINHTYRPKP